jgi:O-antigen ligase
MTGAAMAATARRDMADEAGLLALLGFAGALQISIAAANILLTIALLLWVVSLAVRRARPEVPPFFWPLLAYGGATLLSVAFSLDPLASLIDSKQLVLYLIVPAVFQLARSSRTRSVVTVVVSVGAASAAIGVIQYGMLGFDGLRLRPQGTLNHYMTYSGLLMLVIVLASSRILFDTRERLWPALIMPALLVALAVSLGRSAWVGTCVGVGILLVLKDLRLLAALPLVAGLLLIVAPAPVTERFYSMFDAQDKTRIDRLAMVRAGVRMVQARPLTGMGPNMVQRVYPQYRDETAVKDVQPHLHNVPLQIAAERGVPALLVWTWMIGFTTIQLIRRLKDPARRPLAAAALGCIGAMVAAGMFEHNFGDSEFLMLFLVLITLPFAAERDTETAVASQA